MAELFLKGDIISNDYKWAYDWFGLDSTCPADAKAVVDAMEDGEDLDVYINSPGGDVQAGMELYSIFSRINNSTAHIDGFAASAAGVAAMGCTVVEMSPVSTIMVHNVWCSGIEGDYHDMDKASKMLKSLNASMASAYVAKSGRDLQEVLNMMDKETWLTAQKAVEYGFCDGITVNESDGMFTNAFGSMQLTKEMYDKAVAERQKAEDDKKALENLLSDLDNYGKE